MSETIGWMEFRGRYPQRAAELERIYSIFVSFLGNCLFKIEDGKIEVHDLYNMDNTWCCDEKGVWSIDSVTYH